MVGPHQIERSDPDLNPHRSEMKESDPHQSKKQDPDQELTVMI